jgi:small subunit ribosomal protein S21
VECSTTDFFDALSWFCEAKGLGPHPALLEIDGFMQIIVRDNNVDQALRALKKKLQREGVYREMKLRRHYEKPSEKRARERAAAIRRARKLERKRAERDGVR